MMFLGELVCAGCRKIISYPLGAISCRCRNCNTVNAAQNMHLECGCCGQSILVPVNTLTFLCPCCATVTDIPQPLLPRVDNPFIMGLNGELSSKTIYVTYPHGSSKKGGLMQEAEGPERHKSREEEEHEMVTVNKNTAANDEEESPRQKQQRRRQREQQSMVMVVGTRIL
ncbi:hypothetical protein C3747_35g74 [Trypanosoma cruzi]|uniref:Zinc finger LSD1-type domain-containing protein n=2 Tax=Trypanosoma cruzi TaxID=5693 RepID=Q4DUK8_TRYCC|nr:hypothetical protein, conserved [Trypanosoma cruzi]EAN96209.1 hypothetical protein, conserved [Trypanosoma cruzi]PWV14535.1 hypothetical protein C3747_35g74 [Trypanosoma cruzi]|eukprot:XP_818060.1 hypothetical protein [Trypanosoma cruzi strain CL Brener]